MSSKANARLSELTDEPQDPTADVVEAREKLETIHSSDRLLQAIATISKTAAVGVVASSNGHRYIEKRGEVCIWVRPDGIKGLSSSEETIDVLQEFDELKLIEFEEAPQEVRTSLRNLAGSDDLM